MLLSEAFEMYRTDYIVFRGQSSSTEESHLLATKSLISFVGDIALEDLTFQHVRNWKNSLEKRMTVNSSRLYLIKLRNVIKFARLNNIKCINEASIGVPRRVNSNVEFLTESEVKTLLASISRKGNGYSNLNRLRNSALISLLYASGIRVSELCRINRTDLRSERSFTVIGKGNKPRLCFYDERTKQLVDEYLLARKDSNPALFICELTGDRITAGIVQLIFRNASKKAGFSKSVHPHMMRHSFATNLLKNNTNLFYVSKFLGHSSMQTTEMYTHYVDEDLRKIYGEKHTF